MAQLSKKIELYAAANDVASVEFEKRCKIKRRWIWSLYLWMEFRYSQPTTEQITNSYETAANAAEANAVIDATRRTEYLSWATANGNDL